MTKKNLSLALAISGIGLTATLYQNCAKESFSSTSSSNAALSVPPIATPAIDCSNLSNSTSPLCANTKGFTGSLYVEPASEMKMGYHGTTWEKVGATDVDIYVSRDDWKQPVTVSLSSLTIPEENFTKGFLTPSGASLTDSSGNVLNQWFALKVAGVFHLDSTDTAGSDYQFAIVSDDGAKVFYSTDGTTYSETLIDNQTPGGTLDPSPGVKGQFLPGTQWARMGCSAAIGKTASIHVFQGLQVTDKIPLQVIWYQGPLAGLGVYLMYRKVPSVGTNTASATADAYCETSLDGGFAPGQATYNDLFNNHGWKPVGPANLD